MLNQLLYFLSLAHSLITQINEAPRRSLSLFNAGVNLMLVKGASLCDDWDW